MSESTASTERVEGRVDEEGIEGAEESAETEGKPAEPRVNKREYIARVAKRAGVPVRVATLVYDAGIEELLETLANGDKLTLTGFGKFYPQVHKGHRVQTKIGRQGEEVTVEPDIEAMVEDYAVVKFSATRAVNKKIGAFARMERPEPPAKKTPARKAAAKKPTTKKTTAQAATQAVSEDAAGE
jgi:DNA-binding protein HU-beta